ncbi:transposase, partial [Streptomyces sp. NPDC059956]
AYAEAVRTACPEAIQVADRFHLWKNLCEAVEKCVATHRSCLAEATEDAPAGATDGPKSATKEEVPVRPEGMRVIRRHERHAAVHDLYDKGVPVRAISEALGLDRKTVRRYAHAATPEDASLATGSRRQGESTPTRPTSSGVGTRAARTRHGSMPKSPSSASPAANGPCAGISRGSAPAANPHPTSPRR